MISGAFKDQHGSIAYPPTLLPSPLTLKNWETLLFSMWAPRWLLNSVIVPWR